MSNAEMDDAVRAVRAFNRFHTGFAGALAPRYMDSPLSLIEARMLYEIVNQDGILAAELQRRLRLDAGYASRMLRRFQGEGWIARGRGDDARQRPIHMTAEGLEFFNALDARTRADVVAQLAPLGAEGRRNLVSALGTARALLGDSETNWSLRDFRAGDMGMITARQSILYGEANGWGRPMEALIGEITARFLRDYKPGRERCWVAERGGRMAGSIFVCDSGDNAAQLRLLYVEPDARGLGLGEALVNASIEFARDAGYDRIWLWTHSVLISARRIYAACGFERIKVEMHDEFGEPEQGETWELRFRD